MIPEKTTTDCLFSRTVRSWNKLRKARTQGGFEGFARTPPSKRTPSLANEPPPLQNEPLREFWVVRYFTHVQTSRNNYCDCHK